MRPKLSPFIHARPSLPSLTGDVLEVFARIETVDRGGVGDCRDAAAAAKTEGGELWEGMLLEDHGAGGRRRQRVQLLLVRRLLLLLLALIGRIVVAIAV